jgi:uncharacterized repeat protein (TIGR01451 family)
MGKRLGALIGAVVAIILVGPGAADAATFDVDSTPDVTHAGGCTAAPDDCSIRDAVTAANASADASNTIDVPSGTYPITAGQLEVLPAPAHATIFAGAGARDTILDAGGASRVFAVEEGDTTISGMTITGGSSTDVLAGQDPQPGDGGGIVVSASSAGAGGAPSLILVDSTVTGNTAAVQGGGIAAPSFHSSPADDFPVTVERSTISDNHLTGGTPPVAALGAGINTFGDLTVTNSTITGNTVDSPAVVNMGGGIGASLDPTDAGPTTVSITNTTISGNTVTGDPTSSGGGLMIGSTSPTVGLSVTNTIIQGNAVNGAEQDCSGLVAPTTANNLTGDATCMFTDAGSVQGDPQLGALAANGGATDTMLPAEGSPAIDAGTDTGCPATDQRGVNRPQRTACDIGAVEVEPLPVPPPPPHPTPSADLAVKLTADPDRPDLGQRVNFAFTVTNAGPDDATGTVVTGKLPGRAKRVKSDQDCKVAKRGKRYRLRCVIGTLANGASDEFSVKVRPKKGLRKPRATIQAASAVMDPNPANNKAKKKVTVDRG